MPVPSVHPIPLDWIAGIGDWFDQNNWNPAQVPTAVDDANVNNGGTAQVTAANPGAIFADTLNVGTDGGTGRLEFDVESDRINVSGSLNIGVTFVGAVDSEGHLNAANEGSRLFEGLQSGVMRIGVTEAAGDADGQFIGSDTFFQPAFAATEIGVARSTGNAVGSLLSADGGDLISGGGASLDVGVAADSGTAQATVSVGDVEEVSRADIGTSSGTGQATANMTVRTLEGVPTAIDRGPLRIGVSDGPGIAIGQVESDMFYQSFTGQVTRFTDLDVGVANSTGSANGTLAAGNGLDAVAIRVGVSPGGGPAAGRLFVSHGDVTAQSLTLGGGATLELNLNGAARASGNEYDEYSNATVDSAVLGGALVLNLRFTPVAPSTFEIINASSATGIDGAFDSVTVNDLPSGLTVSSGVQFDGGGNEQFVVNVGGALDLPNWTNPSTGAAAGDWFNASNWSSGSLPVPADNATIANGGEASAEALTASGSLVAADVIVGLDGGDGGLRTDGVDLEPSRNLLIGRTTPGNSTGDTTTGNVTVEDASIRLQFDPTLPGTGLDDAVYVGFAEGTATASGSLTLNNGSLLTRGGVSVGRAQSTGITSSPTANGTLVVNGAGPSVTEIVSERSDFLQLGRVEVAGDAAGSILSSSVEATIANASIPGVDIARARLSTGDVTATLVADPISLSNVDMDFIDIGRLFLNRQPGIDASASASVTLTDVTGSRWFWGDISSNMDGVASSDLVVTATRANFAQEETFVRIGAVDAFGAGQSTVSAQVTVEDSTIIGSTLDFGVFRADGATASAEANVTVGFTGSSLSVRSLSLSDGRVNDAAIADIFSELRLTNSTVTVSTSSEVGVLSGDGTSTDSDVSALLSLTGSSLTTPSLEVAATQSAAGTLEGVLTLNPSIVETDDLTVGPGGTLNFGLEGIDRVTLATVGAAGTYAAIDATEALVDGTIVADFGFVPPTGTHHFDLIVTASSTALDDFVASTSVTNLPIGFAIDSFGVTNQGGVDVLRLTISGSAPVDLSLTKTDGLTTSTPGSPVSYELVATNSGPSAMFGATLLDLLPDAVLGATWTCTASPGSACTASGSGDVADTIDLQVGGTVSYTVIGTIDPQFVGVLSNTATVDAGLQATDTNTLNNQATDNTSVVSAALVTGTKTVVGDFAPGGTISYSIVLENEAAAPQQDDPLEDEFVDVLPDQLSLAGLSATSGVIDEVGGIVTWNGVIPAGGSVTLTIFATIVGTAVDEQEVVNQGTVFFDSDGDGSNDQMVLTDDPNVEGSDDPTVFLVSSSIAAIPTAGMFGVLMLALLLAASGWRLLRLSA